ncbi:DUF2292 domain-containing protein [Ornithinibacillus gellani]|uniref:YezD family protein n=1 Tax=Ornithinibacillus gellani TaxID=2293253 RepID=UPI000F4776EC|nr:YezD family protein [Ornithinibacillus gellani]TQS74618.1 DUF2292 domain-containing protein [Ornithinibacillus gellani]
MSKYNDEQLDYILENLEEINYGTIHIVVHEGKITQIETTEKRRFPNQPKQKLKRITKTK